ncbi:MAG: hypothetical protein ACRDOW_11155 [Nocardioidaceae bacterium]
MVDPPRWEQAGAGSGLLAVALFVCAFIIFMTTNPTGNPGPSDIGSAQLATTYLSQHVSALRVEILLLSLGLALFLWFVGALVPSLRVAEGEPGRGSASAAVGAVCGTVLIFAGLAVDAAVLLSNSPAQADAVPALYTVSALLVAYGGAVLSLFFFAAGKVIVQTRVLGRWLGVLAYIAGILCLFAFLTPFFPHNVFNAATGALGLWAWLAGTVVWLLLCSSAMAFGRRRQSHVAQHVPTHTVTTGVS